MPSPRATRRHLCVPSACSASLRYLFSFLRCYLLNHSCHRASSTTFTQIFLSRGPSNSQKNTPCHCPNTNFPFSTKITCDVPVKTALACESEFPSACRYGPDRGTKRSNTPSKSVATSGSKCSLMITPAVVCGTNTWHNPDATPAFATAFSTKSVTSTNCVRRPVFTRKTSITPLPKSRKFYHLRSSSGRPSGFTHSPPVVHPQC